VTNTITKSSADSLYGPFPSRAAAERYCDEALNLFLLRRCYPDLDPDPSFPGCVYSEMKMCLAPCFQGCTDDRYTAEAASVRAFLATRGESLLDALAKERDAASEDLDFEKAAAVHARIQKVEAVSALASEAVRPLSQLRAMIVMPASSADEEPGRVALFQLNAGLLTGPALYDTFSMRLHNEQSGSSSLYTHPYAIEAVPLQDGQSPAAIAAPVKDAPRDLLEQMLAEALASLSVAPSRTKSANQTIADHLGLFTRWFYRPDAKRVGEVVFYEQDQPPPSRAILRAISRVYRGTLPTPSRAFPNTNA
jgi:excinuclease ABC subunit C